MLNVSKNKKKKIKDRWYLLFFFCFFFFQHLEHMHACICVASRNDGIVLHIYEMGHTVTIIIIDITNMELSFNFIHLLCRWAKKENVEWFCTVLYFIFSMFSSFDDGLTQKLHQQIWRIMKRNRKRKRYFTIYFLFLLLSSVIIVIISFLVYFAVFATFARCGHNSTNISCPFGNNGVVSVCVYAIWSYMLTPNGIHIIIIYKILSIAWGVHVCMGKCMHVLD